MMIFKQVMVGMLQVNCYVLIDEATRQTAVIDPGAEVERILSVVDQENGKVVSILLTHGHFDHIGSVAELKEQTQAPIYIHEADAPMLEGSRSNGLDILGWEYQPTKADHFLKEGDELAIGESTIKVLETPGHTPGGVSFLCENKIFTGDCLFREGLGRTDLPGGDLELICASIKRLTELDGGLEVCPGHGPFSTVAHEAACNPALHPNQFF